MLKHYSRRCLFPNVLFFAACLALTFNLASSAAGNLSSKILTLTEMDANQCSNSISWFGSGLKSIDCIGAVQLLYDREVTYWKEQDFEFISAKVKGRSIPWQRTPRKYSVGRVFSCCTLWDWIGLPTKTAGTCTLAIVMLNFFAPGELPGTDEGPHASRDVTTFYDIWQAARQIETACLVREGKPGWAAPAGKSILHYQLCIWSSLINLLRIEPTHI